VYFDVVKQIYAFIIISYLIITEQCYMFIIFRNCFVVADVVAFAGVQPVLFDEWKIDAAVCNSQKGLGPLQDSLILPTVDEQCNSTQIIQRKQL